MLPVEPLVLAPVLEPPPLPPVEPLAPPAVPPLEPPVLPELPCDVRQMPVAVSHTAWETRTAQSESEVQAGRQAPSSPAPISQQVCPLRQRVCALTLQPARQTKDSGLHTAPGGHWQAPFRAAGSQTWEQ